MKQTAKRIFYKTFGPLVQRFGYVKKQFLNNSNNTNTFAKNSLLHNFFNIIKFANFSPEHIIDVGANHGTWTREALTYFPDCRFTLLEPQAHMRNSVKDLLESNSNISFYAVGAGKTAGIFDFTIVDRDDSCTFIYSVKDAEDKNFSQIKVPVVTLNEFIKEQNLPSPDIIKIDAEGLDIDVLEGSDNFFGRTEIFMVEAGIVNKQFRNSFLELANFMDNNGYRLFDITDLNRPFSKPVLWLTELVFVKKGGIIDLFNWT